MCKAGFERWETRGGHNTVPEDGALDKDGTCEKKKQKRGIATRLGPVVSRWSRGR